MKYRTAIIIFASVILLACSSKKAVVSDKSGKSSIQKTVLTSEEQRKFDFFFNEAAREKMKGNIQKSVMYLNECLKLDPTSAATMYELANILVAGNEVVKAQALLERAMYLEPDNIWYKLMLAELYQQNKLGIKAIAIYEDMVSRYPNNEGYLYGLAKLYQNNGEFEKSIDTYEKLEKAVGFNEVIILEKEQLYLSQKENKEAFNELQRLIKKDPTEPRYYGYMAEYYLYINDITNAKLYFKKVIEMDPGNSLAYFSLGNIAKSENNEDDFIMYYEEGLAQTGTPFEVKFQRILPLLMKSADSNEDYSYIEDFFKILIDTHPNEVNAYIYLGNYYQATNDKEKALKCFEKSIVIQPSNEMVWQEYILLLLGTEDVDLAYTKSLQAVDLFPSNPFFYLVAASSAMQKEENQKALDLLEKGYPNIQDNDKMKAQYMGTMGDVYYALKQPDKAFTSYDESLKYDEFNIVVLNNYSYYLTLENKDLDKAESMSSKCINLEPGNATYLDTYAWVLFKRGSYFEAKYIIERAIDNGGDSSDVIVEHYGDILYKSGDVDHAIEQWNKSKSMGNSSELLERKIETGTYIEE